MSDPFFNQYVRTTMGGAIDSASREPLTPAQIDSVSNYLKSPGSGASASTSFEDFVVNRMLAYPPALSPGMEYVLFSGIDDSGISNYVNAIQYTEQLSGGGLAGIIGDTAWGYYLDNAQSDKDLRSIEKSFAKFLHQENIDPRGGDAGKALVDMMWNAGSGPYVRNAIESRLPIVAFVRNAQPGRGFDSHELPLLLEHGEVITNGYRMDSTGPHPLPFLGNAANEFNQLEHSLAMAAARDGKHVDVSDIRQHVHIASGYDANGHLAFGHPLVDFHKLDLAQMAVARNDWVARLAPQNVPSHSQRFSGRPQLPANDPVLPESYEDTRGSGMAHEEQTGLGRTAEIPDLARATPNLATRGLALAGAAAVVYDTATTAHKASNLLHTGNTTGAQSEVTHFASRNLGMLGGAEVVGSAAMLAGVESGPGVIVFGAVGAVAGAVGGDAIANAIDNHRIYNQKDGNGQNWHYDPKHPDQGWTRSEIVLTEVEHASPHFDRIQHHADAALSQSLSYKATNTAVELTLAREYTPKDPYSQAASPTDTPSVREANWTRDPQTHAWSRQVVDGTLEHGMISSHRETATPERTAALNRAVAETVAANVAASPKGIAEQYLASYEKAGWHSQGPVPEAVSHALEQSSKSHQASDGHVYTQTAQGQWQTPGVLYGTNEATGNIRDELNATQLASTHAAESSAGESAAGTPCPAQSMSRAMAPGGLDEQARMQASMHGGDAAARNQAARQLSDEHKVEAPRSPVHSRQSDASYQPVQVNDRDEVQRRGDVSAEDHQAAASARVSAAHQMHDLQAARVAAEAADLRREAEASVPKAEIAAAASAEMHERDEAVGSTHDIKHEPPTETGRATEHGSHHEGEPEHHADSRLGDELNQQPRTPASSHPHDVQRPNGVERGQEAHEPREASTVDAISPTEPQSHVPESSRVSVVDRTHQSQQVEIAQPAAGKAAPEETASLSDEIPPKEASSKDVGPHEVSPPDIAPREFAEPKAAAASAEIVALSDASEALTPIDVATTAPDPAASAAEPLSDAREEAALPASATLLTDAVTSPDDTQAVSDETASPGLDSPTTALPDSYTAARPGDLQEQPWPGAGGPNDITLTHASPAHVPTVTNDAGAGDAATDFEPAAPMPRGEFGEPVAAVTNPFGPGSELDDPEIADLWFALQSKNPLAIDQACDALGQRPEAQHLSRQADQFIANDQAAQMSQAAAMAPDGMAMAAAQGNSVIRNDSPVMMMTLLNNPSIPTLGSADQGASAPSGGDGGGGGGG